MPQWARIVLVLPALLRPENKNAFLDKTKEQYWDSGRLYVGGVEHACCTCSTRALAQGVVRSRSRLDRRAVSWRLVNQG